MTGGKYIVVLGHGEMGGAERQGLRLANLLAAEPGMTVEVWQLCVRGDRVAEHCARNGLAHRVVAVDLAWDRWGLLKSLLRFGMVLRGARPDVILPSTHIPNVFCGVVWRWTGATACLWNQRDEGNITSLQRRIERLACRNMPGFITNSRGGAEFLAKTLYVSTDRITLVPNAVVLDPPQMQGPAWRARLGLEEGSVVGCMVGSVSKFKDHVTLLKAWRLVLDGWSSGHARPVLLLAGKLFEGAEHIKALAFDLDLGSSVRFLGEVEDIAGLLQAVDIALFSSRKEGLPNGVLECMAAGLPIVASSIPGVRDAVGDHQQAWLAPAGDAAEMAKRFLALVADRATRQMLGRSNRQRIAERFSCGVMMEALHRAVDHAVIEARPQR